LDTFGVGISLEVVKAKAIGSVVLGFTKGIYATGLKQTGILTHSLDAGHIIRTLKITFAAS
jgi:hypothetical protein